MSRITLHSANDEQTRRLGRALAAVLGTGDVVALEGELGAGKTCLVRGLAEGLGVNARDVSSPTFVICHEYLGGGGRRLAHVDAYRLEGAEELETFGFSDLLEQDGCIMAIEWADRIAGALPADLVRVTISHTDEHEREIDVVGRKDVVDALRESGLPVAPRSMTCSICGKVVEETTPSFPFCSSRCRDADLGRWFKGNYSISRPAVSDDLE